MRQLLPAVAIAIAVSVSRLPQSQPESGASLALTGAEVIDTTGGPSQPNMTVIVSGDRIVRIGRDGRTRIPTGALVVDAAGTFLIPGLWDMHVHSFFGQRAESGSAITSDPAGC